MNNGMLRPHAATVMIALDKADAGNGCLQVWPKSHKCGVLPHGLVGEQTGASKEHVEALARDYARVDVLLNPGDACFFHCDLMHVSYQNTSDRRRWCFLVSFNRMDNSPVWTHHHPMAYEMPRTEDDAFSKVPEGLPVDPAVKDFMVPVTSIKDGKSVAVAEQWKARGSTSSGYMMGTTAAAARGALEGKAAGGVMSASEEESKVG